jgi:hypothetical protein
MKLTRRRAIQLGIALSAATALTASYSTIIEPSSITLTKLKLNMGFKLKVVHISDTHFGLYWFNVGQTVELIESLKPDVIFHTGDLITYTRGLEDAVSFLERLSRTAPIYMVAGNHDHWSGLGSEGLKQEVKGLAKVLNNESITLDGLTLVGVDDPFTGHDDLAKAYSEVRDGYKILLAHTPQIVDDVDKFDLILVGHTHGGQVRLPFLGPLYIPLPPKYRKYDYGLFEPKSRPMFVTRGLGMSFLPFRFACPPEVVLIELE